MTPQDYSNFRRSLIDPDSKRPMTQARLAQLLGVNRRTIQGRESMRAAPRYQILKESEIALAALAFQGPYTLEIHANPAQEQWLEIDAVAQELGGILEVAIREMARYPGRPWRILGHYGRPIATIPTDQD